MGVGLGTYDETEREDVGGLVDAALGVGFGATP